MSCIYPYLQLQVCNACRKCIASLDILWVLVHAVWVKFKQQSCLVVVRTGTPLDPRCMQCKPQRGRQGNLVTYWSGRGVPSVP